MKKVSIFFVFVIFLILIGCEKQQEQQELILPMVIEGTDVPNEGEPIEVTAHGLILTPPKVTFTEGITQESVSGTISLAATAEDDEDIIDFVLYINGEPVAFSEDNATLHFEWDTTQYEDGVYTVNADAMDELFAIGGARIVVIVDNSDPIADAGPEVEGKVGESVFFDASNSVGVSLYGYSWDFGDGKTQDWGREGAVHVYDSPGTYTVTLTVYDDMGKTSIAQTTAHITSP